MEDRDKYIDENTFPHAVSYILNLSQNLGNNINVTDKNGEIYTGYVTSYKYNYDHTEINFYFKVPQTHNTEQTHNNIFGPFIPASIAYGQPTHEVKITKNEHEKLEITVTKIDDDGSIGG